jgi:aspartyl-tRNA(Asn)/glutamyl-tRNA(Gln) amidotransferase subunit C
MDKSELVKTAALAKLKLDENEVEKLAVEVTAMLENFSLMMEADIEGLEPTTQTLQQENRTRSDSPGSSNLSNDLLDRVPVREDRFIVIPNVI